MLKKLMFTLLLLVPSYALAVDLTITPANVSLAGTETRTLLVTFGETVTNGQVVYRKVSDNKYWKADNDVTVDTAEVAGIVLSGNSADGQGIIVIGGPITIGAATTAGVSYVLSSTAGGIAPAADLGTGDYISSLGHATTTAIIWLNLKNYGVLMP
jgi:hypothetical protein